MGGIMKFKYILGLALLFIGEAYASDDEGDLTQRRVVVISDSLKPADFFEELKPFLVRHGEENPKLKALDAAGIEDLNKHLKQFWPFRFCDGVDGLSLLLTAHETGLKLDRGFRSQYLALRVWMRAPEFKGFRETMHFLPLFSVVLNFYPVFFTNYYHAPADALTVIDLKNNLDSLMDLAKWAKDRGLITEVNPHPIGNMLCGGISTFLFMMNCSLARVGLFHDRGRHGVKDILYRIQTTDEYWNRENAISTTIWGGMLVGMAYWNWHTLFATLTGNLVSFRPEAVHYGKYVATEFWKNYTGCYIQTIFQQYIPCNASLPMVFVTRDYVFEYATYVYEATVTNVLPWMIPHILNLIWFFWFLSGL